MSEQRKPSEAEDKRSEAEAARAHAEAEKFHHEARHAKADADKAELELENARRKHNRDRALDAHDDHSYQFGTSVDPGSVKKCMEQLAQWNREDPECAVEIVFDSPGGSVTDGMHLFDYIQDYRKHHHVTTRTRGLAASMAGILLQAGDVRVMGAQASLMIHEASFGTSGKTGDVEDMVEWVNKVQERILTIFADRAAATNAPKKISRRQLKTKWRRKNWWLDASEALDYGLVDEIR